MIWIGTSGYSYPEWKGSFYPKALSTAKMLGYYSARFATVEINNTFYRMPDDKAVQGWADGTPSPYKLTLKSPRRITHDARLKGCEDALAAFASRARLLGPKLGTLLFQLPPFLKKDVGLLEGFLATMPTDVVAAFEFRHASWFDDAVLDALRAKNAVLCIADSEKLSAPVEATSDVGYFRLRDEGYDDAAIEGWAKTILDRKDTWKDVFVYFKHEDAGKGPAFAKSLMAKLRAAGVPVAGGADLPGMDDDAQADAAPVKAPSRRRGSKAPG